MNQWVARAIELLEDLRLLARRDADASIRYLALQRAIHPVQFDRQELILRRILQRVVDQVDERARDRLPVDAQGWNRPIDALLELEALLLDLIAIGIEGATHQLGEIGLAEVILLASRLDAGEIENIVDQGGQPLALLADDAIVPRNLLPRLNASELERLRVQPNQRERRPELVRDIGNEVGLQAGDLDLPADAAVRQHQTTNQYE